VVAQLGTTYQILSFSWLSFRASVTSWGFIAVMDISRQLADSWSSHSHRGKGGGGLGTSSDILLIRENE
jgi:hypothetical protein